ncbi:MAG: hypothetical protein E1N59_709 [Puniceicoccaceae bacterium 5H]|nr:MAG: hypothetical protein E1N59_709 [Puniceicoccaceae bacterium 5H]
MLNLFKQLWENLREAPINKEYLYILYRHLSDHQLQSVAVEGLSREARDIWRAEMFRRNLVQYRTI